MKFAARLQQDPLFRAGFLLVHALLGVRQLVGLSCLAGVAVSPAQPATYFLSERQEVGKKRVAYAAGNQFHGVGGSGGGDFRSAWVPVRAC
ncbi:hypothetical protein [Cupriavidus nantongensis]|uniref:hypothetical protein n=1 Tax=Cupriavidus nantongensis TaxID=1796606 RepID=UPI00358E027D